MNTSDGLELQNDTSTNLTGSTGLVSVRAVFWLFHIGSKVVLIFIRLVILLSFIQEQRAVPDNLYLIMLTIIFLLAIFTHLPSFCLLIRDFRRGYVNNANLIYRNLFIMDLIFMFLYLPFDIFWTITRQSQFICKFIKFNAFFYFFGGCIFLIILAVDRFSLL